jgi:hypothetical protein
MNLAIYALLFVMVVIMIIAIIYRSTHPVYPVKGSVDYSGSWWPWQWRHWISLSNTLFS